ncbi:hypothetical protein RJT34_20036 [Clitoria ternatea]|uniref:Uncharacterized protein n=1 Tax=Clitoria ternatea TaxID=43366 RepID=A0AAN9ISF3_CLITE
MGAISNFLTIGFYVFKGDKFKQSKHPMVTTHHRQNRDHHQPPPHEPPTASPTPNNPTTLPPIKPSPSTAITPKPKTQPSNSNPTTATGGFIPQPLKRSMSTDVGDLS